MNRAIIRNATAFFGMLTVSALAALGTTYPDTAGDNWGPVETDIVSVDVTNDATSLSFSIHLNPSSNLTTNYYPNFEVGIQTHGGAGGQTVINGNYGLGDPAIGSGYGTPVGISTGMNFFVGTYLDGPTYSGGAELFGYSTTAGWNKIGFTAPIAEVPTGTPSITFSLPLGDLGLSAGDVLKFDVWSTFSGANSAYDALQNPVKTFDGTADLPYAANGNPPANYDSATASGSLLSTRGYTVVGAAVSGTWTGATSGNWSDAGNWSGGVPNGVGHAATFDSSATGNFNVTVDGARTVGSIAFGGATSYTLGGSGPITLDAASGPATVSASAGSHSIASPVALNDDLTVSTAASSNVSFAGSVTATGYSITKDGAGTAQFENVRSAGLNIAAGSLRISQKGTANSEPGASSIGLLSIAAGAELDLKNNALIVDYTAGSLGTQLTDLRAHLLAGRLKTTSAANRRIGYLDNAALASPRTSFAGVSVDASSLLLAYAAPGDTNLDGLVNFDDLLVVAQNYTQTNRFWVAGDFDYNGTVNFDDLLLIAQNYGASGFVAGGSFAGDWALAQSLAPEPATFAGALASVVLGLARRRRD